MGPERGDTRGQPPMKCVAAAAAAGRVMAASQHFIAG